MRKGVKVSKEQNNEGKRQRSTQQELCVKYNKERSKLYVERKRLNVSIASGELSEKKLGVASRRLDRIDVKIDRYKVKLFKCGKKYAKLKDKKRKLSSRIKYLCKSIEKRDQELEGKKLSAKDKKKEASIKKSKCKELAKLDDELAKLKSLMDLNIYGFKPSDLDVTPHVPSGNFFSTNVGIWDLNSSLTDILGSKIYDVIYLDGLEYVIPTNNFELINDIKDRVDEMTEERKEGGNYQVIIEFDRVLKIIRITTR
jgi:chromosome segregation ATPase